MTCSCFFFFNWIPDCTVSYSNRNLYSKFYTYIIKYFSLSGFMERSGKVEKFSERDLVSYSLGWSILLDCQIPERWDDMQRIVVGSGLCPNNSEVEVR